MEEEVGGACLARLGVGARYACRTGMAADGRQSLGRVGEDLACGELTRRGYAILERRYRSRYGEIDIIARSDGTWVFVEIKARSGQAFGGGGAAVTRSKQQQIIRRAEDFLARRHIIDEPCRFDVVTVDVGSGEPRIEVYPHAFTA